MKMNPLLAPIFQVENGCCGGLQGNANEITRTPRCAHHNQTTTTRMMTNKREPVINQKRERGRERDRDRERARYDDLLHCCAMLWPPALARITLRWDRISLLSRDTEHSGCAFVNTLFLAVSSGPQTNATVFAVLQNCLLLVPSVVCVIRLVSGVPLRGTPGVRRVRQTRLGADGVRRSNCLCHAVRCVSSGVSDT